MDENSITVVIPFVKEDGRVDHEGEAEEVDSPKRMLEILGELQEKIGVNQPIFSILLTSFKAVCPVALIGQSHFELIKLESYARDYHVLPYPGGSLDQPNLIMEAFDVIATARSWYERDRIEEMRRRAEAARQKGAK